MPTSPLICFWVGYRTDRTTSAIIDFELAVPRAVISMTKPVPELSAIERPRCIKCAMRMTTSNVAPGPDGFEHRTFVCSRCGHTDSKVVASDPLKSDAVGWLSGELGQNAAATHEVRDGRLVLRPPR
jgi:hypothetical protein